MLIHLDCDPRSAPHAPCVVRRSVSRLPDLAPGRLSACGCD